jgi:hypothetical protein
MNMFRSLLGGLATLACVAASQPIDTRAPVRQSAPVVVANRTIIVLRGPIAGYSARERAAATSLRIEEALESNNESPVVSTADAEDGTKVLIDGSLAFLVTRIDIDPQVGETTLNVAREAGTRLQVAIVDYGASSIRPATCRSPACGRAHGRLRPAVAAVVDRPLGRAACRAGRRLRAEKVHVHA